MKFVKSGSIRKFQFTNKEECIGCVIEMNEAYVTLITGDGMVRAARVDAIEGVILGNFEDGLRKKLLAAYMCYKELEALNTKYTELKSTADRTKRVRDAKEGNNR